MIAIADAACRVLTRQGWRLAQVADVAREAGVAAGTVYLYAADKPALRDLAIRAAARLPLPQGPMPADTAATLEAALACFALPRAQALLNGASPAEDGTLAAIVAEMHDLLAREARLILLLDRLSLEDPAIRDAWQSGMRLRGFGAFAAAVARLGEAGLARGDLDPALAARAVLEMLAWMAMRRRGDAQPPPGDEAAARAAAIALGVAALELPSTKSNTPRSIRSANALT
jgi:AcrR family transcriptional regulator